MDSSALHCCGSQLGGLLRSRVSLVPAQRKKCRVSRKQLLQKGRRQQYVLQDSRQSTVCPAVLRDTELKERWWMKSKELWTQVESVEQFDKLLEGGDKYVFVDFYATWCSGCKRSYPELCRLAADKDLQKNFIFAKVDTEALKPVAKREEVLALPYAAVYKQGNPLKLYGFQAVLSRLKRELGSRLGPGHHYLDYTGSSLYTASHLESVFQELRTNVFGNPHSANPSSKLTSDRVEEVRDMVMQFFNAPPGEYQLVFTKSATDALKIVGETFPWRAGSQFKYLRENHNSVLGMRQYALEHGGGFQAVDEAGVEAWLKSDEEEAGGSEDVPVQSLFAFPAEENFAGVKYPLRWIQQAQAKSSSSHHWYVLLDAAAYVPTQPLDIKATMPDFVSISFYKMFGYPTGLGALILRTEHVDVLRKVFFGGGTVSLATSRDDFHVLKCKPTDKLEDGTLAFLDIISLKHGFQMIKSLGGIPAIQAHVKTLTAWLYKRLSEMKHSNGAPMAQIFGKHGEDDWEHKQGCILNFCLLDPRGGVYSYRQLEKEAAQAGFHIRTGAECNPGAAYSYLGIADAEVETLADEKEGCDDEIEYLTVQRPLSFTHILSNSDSETDLEVSDSDDSFANGSNGNGSGNGAPKAGMKWVNVPLGSARVSLGYMSTFKDVERFAAFVENGYRDRTG